MSEQIEFEKAKCKLNTSLEELEDLILSKIPNKNMKLELEELTQEVEALITDNIRKDSTIQALENEVNNLQKNMAEIGSETEFLNEKNKTMAAEFRKKEEQQKDLVSEIVDYVNQIEELVKNEN